jgi:hypothetical protein
MAPHERSLARLIQATAEARGIPVSLIGGNAVGLHAEEAGLGHLARRSHDLDFTPVNGRDVDGKAVAGMIRDLDQNAKILSSGHGSCMAIMQADGQPVKISVQWARERVDPSEHVPVDGIRVVGKTPLLMCKLSTFTERLEKKDLMDAETLIRSGADLDGAMRMMGDRSQHGAVDVMEAIVIGHHQASGPVTGMRDGTTWDQVVQDMQARMPRWVQSV